MLDVPAVRLEPLALVLAVERERGRAVDRDPVVVVDVDELTEPELARDRCRLLADALHEVAVGADRVDEAVDDVVLWPIPAIRQVALRDRDADAVGEPLTEWTGGRLDSRRVPPLGVTRRPRAPLPELLEILERDVVPREVQGRVLEDAGVPRGEDEAVAPGPVRLRRIVTHLLGVEQVRDGGERHRGSRVPGVCLLHRVHRERADRVDRLAGEVGHGTTPSIVEAPGNDPVPRLSTW